MKNIVKLLVLACIAAPASAADWRFAYGAKAHAVFVDAESIQRTGDTVRYWYTIIFKVPSPNNSNAKRAIILEIADCSDLSYQRLQGVTYSASGRQTDMGATGKSFAAPDTNAAYILEKVCKGDFRGKDLDPQQFASEIFERMN
ncbi:MAG: surface-adhesin E family protein [Sphingorhabdus lacus]